MTALALERWHCQCYAHVEVKSRKSRWLLLSNSYANLDQIVNFTLLKVGLLDFAVKRNDKSDVRKIFSWRNLAGSKRRRWLRLRKGTRVPIKWQKQQRFSHFRFNKQKCKDLN